ncbi:hypothetical protein TEQG_01520 [Trichophyton equinum CBS 127.97]|uniref:Uncharacterized protein n=1 Tax=Trichophyton equinum (strain ATCC MYA-4606 / CBS 127.97) TaxID=559882 RepID=F2PKR6_TRIEC|nr:hypothetical protein TEQG_01520 [Trichophyton equinum CBS 127.97]
MTCMRAGETRRLGSTKPGEQGGESGDNLAMAGHHPWVAHDLEFYSTTGSLCTVEITGSLGVLCEMKYTVDATVIQNNTSSRLRDLHGSMRSLGYRRAVGCKSKSDIS